MKLEKLQKVSWEYFTSRRQIHEWFIRFYVECKSVVSAEWTGRPLTVATKKTVKSRQMITILAFDMFNQIILIIRESDVFQPWMDSKGSYRWLKSSNSQRNFCSAVFGQAQYWKASATSIISRYRTLKSKIDCRDIKSWMKLALV